MQWVFYKTFYVIIIYMNIEERKNVLFHLLACLFCLGSLGLDAFVLLKVIEYNTQDLTLNCIALAVAMLFALLEFYMNVRKPKKESLLFQICFNENQKINTIPLFAVGIGSLFGLGLTAMAIAVYFVREEARNKAAMLVVLAISVYLLVNCILYWLYLLIFRKKPFNIKDLIK